MMQSTGREVFGVYQDFVETPRSFGPIHCLSVSFSARVQFLLIHGGEKLGGV